MFPENIGPRRNYKIIGGGQGGGLEPPQLPHW